MIAFERFLQENGFELIAGDLKEFNTYDNVARLWKNKDGKLCTVGLYGKPTRIGITHPCVYLDDVSEKGFKIPFTNIPVEKDFNEILKQILAW